MNILKKHCYAIITLPLILSGCYSDKVAHRQAERELKKLTSEEVIYVDQNGDSKSLFPFPENFGSMISQQSVTSLPQEMEALLDKDSQ